MFCRLNNSERFSFKNVLIITKVKSSQARIVLKTPVAIAGVNGLKHSLVQYFLDAIASLDLGYESKSVSMI